jgi:hypothetical protein
MPTLLNEEQLVALRPGERRAVPLKLAGFALGIAVKAGATGGDAVELVVDALTGPYELRRVREAADGRAFEEAEPAADGTAAFRLALATDRLAWTSEGRAAHAISLERARWQDGALAFVLKETDVKF